MENKSITYRYSGGVSSSWNRLCALILTGIMALLLTACGGGDGGNNGTASGVNNQCTLTADELDNLTPDDVDSLPAACDDISFFEYV